ncbi:unnamed protein product [Symbiodinium microadriaticum]|nr:unnamed protein product [Symbiodinium microadriaticum]
MDPKLFGQLLDFCARLVNNFDLPAADAQLLRDIALAQICARTLRRLKPDQTGPVRHDGPYTFYGQVMQPTFSMYNAQYEPATFRDLLRTRQCEQVWLPGQLWPGIPPWETLPVLPNALLLSSLPPLAATLYPGRENPGVYTAAELWIISHTMFHFLFKYPLPGVPRTLGDDMATFMIWITFPSTLLVPKLLQVLRGGLFELRGDECAWLSNQVLNFSFSPRSALLLFTFGLSIRLQQGLSNPAYGRMLTTIGLRLSWTRWNTLLSASRIWNRRYLDYFIGMMPTTTFVLHPSTDAATLSGMVVLLHQVEPDYLVHALNSTFNNSRVFYRLFHLPVPARAYEALTNSHWWDEVPRELLQHYARPRL